jgi:outer membrane protein assembly factor BamB
MVGYTLEGERIWERNLQEDYGGLAFQWTFSASPTLWKGLLYLPILQRNSPVRGIGQEDAPSFLLGIDPHSGETKFEHVRPSDALVESLESYATPIPYVGADGRAEIVVVGGDVITGHDPGSGEELWRWGTWNPGHRERSWRLVPSPVLGTGVALACGPKGSPVTAVRLGGSGLLDDEDIAWQSAGRRDPVTTDVPTPLFYDGDFFVLSDLRGALTRVDAESGKHVWSVKLEGDYRWRASPTGADGKLWIMDHGGVVHVFDAATGERIHQAAMGDPDDDNTRSSIAIAHGSLFVRTNSMLYRIEK